MTASPNDLYYWLCRRFNWPLDTPVEDLMERIRQLQIAELKTLKPN